MAAKAEGLWELSAAQVDLMQRLKQTIGPLQRGDRTLVAAQGVIDEWVIEQKTLERWHADRKPIACIEPSGLVVRWPEIVGAVGLAMALPTQERVAFEDLITIECFSITDPYKDASEKCSVRLLLDDCLMPSENMAVLLFEQSMKHPDSEETWGPDGIELKRWGQVAARISVNMGWSLFCANAGKWDVRMVLCRKIEVAT